MEKINYSQIYAKLTKNISAKIKIIFNRRFGVKSGKAETLESIGQSLGITRERVRQIEEAGFNFVKKNNKEALDKVFADFISYFENKGGFKKEEVALEDLGGNKNKPYVLFLLTLGRGKFFRVCGKKNYHYFWSTMPNSENMVRNTLDSLVSDIEKQRSLFSQKEFFTNFASKYNLNNESLLSYLEVSKVIQKNNEGKFGLINWSEIKPRGIKDRAFLVFKKHQKPLHFMEIAKLIDGLDYNQPNNKTNWRTVHNELIKDQRFVLVGRGTYALKEWGYAPGTIKEVITKVIEGKQQPLNQDEIVKEVLTQRLVAKNTVMINLNNKKYFTKNSDGKYLLRKTETL